MPPRDHIELDPSKIYIAQEGETLVPLDGIQEATLEPAEGGLVDPVIVRASISGEATFTATIDAQYEAYQELYMKPMRAAIAQTMLGIRKCSPHFWMFMGFVKHNHFPSPRLVHLAAHGKPRVRKKNIKRIMRGD